MIPKDIKSIMRILYNTAEVEIAGLKDHEYQKLYPYLPPAGLRKRVAGTTDVAWLINSGINNANELTNTLEKHGYSWSNFKCILDFGCGCSRVLTHLRGKAPKLFGTDIDAKAISWCRKSLNFASFTTNQSLPPTDFPSEFFDLIYSISVFTHLDEYYQFKWLKELRRIASNQSLLLLSVSGDYAASLNVFTELEKQKRLRNGFVHRSYRETFPFPKFYGDTYHTKEYIYKNWNRYFRIVDYIERGITNHQDLVILQKDD